MTHFTLHVAPPVIIWKGWGVVAPASTGCVSSQYPGSEQCTGRTATIPSARLMRGPPTKTQPEDLAEGAMPGACFYAIRLHPI